MKNKMVFEENAEEFIRELELSIKHNKENLAVIAQSIINTLTRVIDSLGKETKDNRAIINSLGEIQSRGYDFDRLCGIRATLIDTLEYAKYYLQEVK